MAKKATNPRLQAQVSTELKWITEKMLEHLDMTQAQFFERYLPSLFLALDKEKYLQLVAEAYESEDISLEIGKLRR